MFQPEYEIHFKQAGKGVGDPIAFRLLVDGKPSWKPEEEPAWITKVEDWFTIHRKFYPGSKISRANDGWFIKFDNTMLAQSFLDQCLKNTKMFMRPLVDIRQK